MFRLTPVIKHIVLLNVAVFILLMLAGRMQQGGPDISWRYFSLHKSNLLGIHPTVELNTGVWYFPIFLENTQTKQQVVMDKNNAEKLLADNPYLRDEAQGIFSPDYFQPLQIVTHFFNHGGFLHILFNMLALASIGPLIELTIGPKRFLRFYLFCGVLGGILVAFLDPSVTPVVGASGAIFGVLVAFAIYFPHQKLMFFFLPPIESRWIVIGLGLISAVLVVIQALSIDIGSVGMLSHFGHLAGMLSAVLYFYLERFMPILKK